MAVPDPEDHEATPAEPGGGAPHREPDTDAAFAAIVAQWRTEADAPRWPADAEHPDADHAHDRRLDDDPNVDDDRHVDGLAGSLAVAGPGTAPGSAAGAPDDGDHYVPPEPPPFPVPRPRTVGGVAALALGVLLLAAPGLLGLGDRLGTPLGLLVLTGALVWLGLGLRSGPPPDSGWDDGARL